MDELCCDMCGEPLGFYGIKNHSCKSSELNIEKIEEIAWRYFSDNDLLRERDVMRQEVGLVAEQYMDEALLAIFIDAFELGLGAGYKVEQGGYK